MFNLFSGLFVAAITIPPAVVALMLVIVAVTGRGKRAGTSAPAAPAPDLHTRAAA